MQGPSAASAARTRARLIRTINIDRIPMSLYGEFCFGYASGEPMNAPVFEVRNGFRDHVIDVVQVIGRNDVGRNGVDDIPQRPQKNTILDKKRIQTVSNIGKI